MSSATKSVLVSYLERNKVIRVPIVKEDTDLEFIRKEFIKLFSFEENVRLCLSFQRFDEDWKDYIEIDEGDDIENKEKIKVIVIPVLGTPRSSNDGGVSIFCMCISDLL